jgi:hypothetical protein
LYRADYTLFPSNKMIYKRGSHCIAVITLIQILSLILFKFICLIFYLFYYFFEFMALMWILGKKLNFGPKIEFRAVMWILGFYNFGPSEMSPARLSNYGPGHGPTRNSNNTGLFGLGPGRAGRPECTPIVWWHFHVIKVTRNRTEFLLWCFCAIN